MSDKNMADVADKALDKVSEMAAAAAKLAPQAWEIMVRQQVIEGVTYSIVCVFWTILAAVFLGWAQRVVRAGMDADTFPPNGKNVTAVFGGCIALALIIGCLISLPGFVLQASNPEYYAIQELLRAAR